MHALRSTRNLLAGLGLAAVMIGSMPGTALALPGNPSAFGTKSSYKLFSRLISYINVNRVYMGVNTLGEIAVDSAGRGTTQGGFWPRGTPDNYVFNSGMQVAGVVAGVKSATNPWGGDTTGGWFFDGAGGRVETEAVTPAYQAFNTADAANWPAQAFVPQGDAVANIYAQPLQGLISASQGDVEFISWDGNPKLNTARLHPLGVMVDYRLLAWNYPAGAQDIVFVVSTIYNITSANCSDYAAQRPAMAQIACAQGAKFQALNNAQFNIQLPVGGYTITNAFTAYAADNDVGTVTANYNGVILPFAMGYTYDGPFTSNITGWKFDPSIFGTPFFAGSGFVGYKYLKGPDGPGAIQLMSTFCNGAATCGAGHADPANMGADYRLMAGQPYPTDGQCNITSPGLTAAQIHFCFMLVGAVGTDTRMIESSTNTSLAPGQAKTIVVAYVYAAPVAIPGFTPNGTNVTPGDVTRTNSTDSMFKYNQSGSPGANKIDSISGFVAYNGPHFNSDGSVHAPNQNEFSVVKGSLLGKALVAQAVFDAHFLQEFAPDAPQFFLIPGNKQVTILWKPSDTETIGDPFFAVVGKPTEIGPGGGTIPNPLYDPNYRQFDVEGYRIYRGRSDSPSALKLLVQFDYAGTKIKDYTGFVQQANPTTCAPELGITGGCPATTPAGGFPTPANPTPPGTAATRFVAYNIGTNFDASGNVYPLMFVDQTAGTREALNGNTSAIATVVDTVVSGAGDQSNGLTNPPLADTGVPFIFTDVAGAPGCTGCGVNNGVNYFYSVTAFDVNAPGHGPTSLESARVTKQVVPQADASNFSSTGNLIIAGPNGRAGALTDNVLPTIDTAAGTFSKKFPPTNAFSVALASFASKVLNGGAVQVRLDSVVLNASGLGTGSELATEWFSDITSIKTTIFSLPVAINDAGFGDSQSSATIPGIPVDSALSSIYGGGTGYSIPASATLHSTDAYISSMWGRGCVNNAASGVTQLLATGTNQCAYNGPRWFIGDNETTPNPISNNADIYETGIYPTTLNNAGTITGVDNIWRPIEYFNTPTTTRVLSGSFAPFISNSDYRLYWGTAGHIDSVIDLTHNVPVPFNTGIESSYGVLNAAALPPSPQTGMPSPRTDGALTFTAITCVAPFKTLLSSLPAGLQCGAAAPVIPLSQTAILGPSVICLTGGGGAASPPTLACNSVVGAQVAGTVINSETGFLLYLKGRIYMMQMAALPASGTQWTVRDYTGGISGGNGISGNWGKYVYLPPTTRQFTAVGVNYTFSANTSNVLSTATTANVAAVHTVPDPYYVTSAYDIAVDAKDIQFVNVPTGATIRIYSVSGVLLRVLQNTTTQFAGIVHWDVRNRTNQFVSSGVYFYTVTAGTATHTGRMTIVQYASTVQ